MLPNKIDWNQIRELYNKARYCLWCPKHAENWVRDEENGIFYLWSAYHYAKLANDNDLDHLTYARILAMMANELRNKMSDYDRYHKYIVPSMQEYENAIAAGKRISDREYESIRNERDSVSYKLMHESADENNQFESLKIIENSELLREKDFSFHDSKPVYFEQVSDKLAVLKLSYDHLLAVFHFENPNSIHIDTDTVANWIEDGYCYRMQNSDLIIFNAGDYTIICKKVVLEKLIDFD